MPGLAQAGNGLGPAEGLLNALSDTLADAIARMAGGATIDGRTPAGGILRQMRRDVDLAQLVDEIAGIETLVAGQGDPAGPVCMRYNQMQGCQALGMA